MSNIKTRTIDLSDFTQEEIGMLKDFINENIESKKDYKFIVSETYIDSNLKFNYIPIKGVDYKLNKIITLCQEF